MRDKILSKEKFRKIIEYLPIQGKAVTLFLANTGARIGDIVQLRTSDLNLDVDPAYADIQQKYLMASWGARRIYFNRESIDAINNWLKTREGEYNDLVFGINSRGFQKIWNQALEKSGLDERDEKHRFIYHLHTIRKFFYTQMKISGMPMIVISLLMGKPVDIEEDRPTEEEVREEYIKHRDAIKIYED